MRQWFSGKFVGHYRGAAQKPSSLAPYQDAQRFLVEVYEAQVTQLVLGKLVPTASPSSDPLGLEVLNEGSASEEHHHVPNGPRLRQHHIPYVHLIDAVYVGQTIRASVRDVLMSDLEFSFPAREGNTSYGRIEGVISGWFIPPPPPPELEMELPSNGIPVGWSSDVIAAAWSDQPPRMMSVGQVPRDDGEEGLHQGDGEADENQDRPAERSSSSAQFPQYPFLAIGAGACGLLALGAQLKAAAIFGVVFSSGYGLRRWLTGVVPDESGVRLLSLIVCVVQVLVGAWLLASWSEAACVRLAPLPLLTLVGSILLTSLLPRPLPFGLTSLVFALILMQAYARWALPLC